jgi:hypothetical protein
VLQKIGITGRLQKIPFLAIKEMLGNPENDPLGVEIG